MAAIDREDWDEFERLFAPEGSVESRRKIVGFKPTEFPADEVIRQTRRDLETGIMTANHVVMAVRGERLALARMTLGTVDVTPGAPQDEFLMVYRVDEEGRIALQIWFDLEDMDAAMAELDAAQARFEDEHPLARRLENTASRVFENEWSHFADRDWDALAELVADNYSGIDHRRVVNAENQYGRDAVVKDLQAAADVGFTISMLSVMAIRGERLVLARVRAAGRDPTAIQNDALNVVEIDAEERIVAAVTFDLEDFDAAIAELESRYITGEAAAYAHTWSVVAAAYAGFNRRELLATTPDWVNIDHRRGAAFAPGDMIAYIQAAWDDSPDTKIYIGAVHRLSKIGAIVTHLARGISQEGFDAEWRDVHVLAVEGDMLSRSELFDEEDLDAAIARFDEFSPPVSRPENTASRANARFIACVNAHDWDSAASSLAEDHYSHDRRRVTGAGTRRGRDADIESMRVVADLGGNVTVEAIATRGDRLVLTRNLVSFDEPQQGFLAELLGVVETNLDGLVAAVITLDAEDVDAAFAELDARYLAGEAAPYAHTWSAVTNCYAAVNRREIPATTTNFVNIDHRKGTPFAPGDVIAYTRASWSQVPDISYRIETVHQMSDLGAVITHTVRGTSHEGFEAEWCEIHLMTVAGDLFTRSELFDEADIHAALAKFDQLTRPAPRLENAASQMADRFLAHFAAGDWDAMAEILADDLSNDDRRRVVSTGVFDGRDAQMANTRAIAELWSTNVTRTVIATRGRNLSLGRVTFSGDDEGVEAFLTEMLIIVELNEDERIAAQVMFDLEDFDAAIAELDARYAAGEAAAHSETWLAIADVYAAVNRGEMPAAATDLVDIDHRSLAAIGSGDLMAYLEAASEDAPRSGIYIETVHRLTDLGAVTTHVAKATSREGFDAEWRITSFFIVGGDLVNRYEFFDETDLEAALARFDELHRQPPRLENTAAQAYERLQAHFAARAWDALAETLPDGAFHDDRRPVVGAGLRKGRDAVLAEFSALAEIGVKRITSDTIATRGSRLVLNRSRASGRDPRADAFRTDVLSIAELDADERIAALITLGPNDFDAAIAELDARYLAGEAAAHAHTWSVITRAYAALNRREHPATTPDWVNIDHRRGISFAPGDVSALLVNWNATPDPSNSIEAVHRLNDLGAVVTSVTHETSQQGFEAEWRGISVLTIEGDLIDRLEIFDEADLDAALARFDELSQPAPRLENVASQLAERFQAHFAARDWAAMGEILADGFSSDDRRRVVGAGVRDGRHAEIADMAATADLGITDVTSTVVATRGGRLALMRGSLTNGDQGPESFLSEALGIVEINADERIVAFVTFDLDDFDAAMAELDARYLAGEAAAHSHAWSIVAASYAALNRQEMPPTTPDCVNVDHRRETAFGPDDLIAYQNAGLDLDHGINIYVEEVHQLNSRGAAITYAAHETSLQGFDAEWRGVAMFTVDGDLVDRVEVFDEADLDAALTRFEELQPHAPRLENAATQLAERLRAHFATRDWAATTELLADDISTDDRRRVVNAGNQHGPDAYIANLRALADLGVAQFALAAIATRGERLSLSRARMSGRDQRPDAFHTEALSMLEVDTDNRMAALVVFDLDDIDAAFAELDARYLAGEAVAYAHTWSVVAEAYAAFNRHELPATDWATIDRRRATPFESSTMTEILRAIWDLTPDLKIHIEAVHRLDSFGAVITHTASGSSPEGFDAEWRAIDTLTVEGDRITGCEIFDEADLDAALARFDELQPQAPRLENAASRVYERLQDYFGASDNDALTEILADNISHDDRRRVVNSGLRHGRDAVMAEFSALAEVGVTNHTSDVIATRGQHLVLSRARTSGRDQSAEAFHVEVLDIVEIDAKERFAARVVFDPDDIDAAFEELDARYLAGEAAAHAHTWSNIAQAYTAVNRHELPPTTPDWVNIDHRRGRAFAPGDLEAYLHATWDLAPDVNVYVEAVHRLSNLGGVVTHCAHGSSQEGFDAEWREVILLTFEAGRINRSEVFDEADLDAALARFDELDRL